MDVDVIILSNASTPELFNMTQQAVTSCYYGSGKRVNITVVEQNHEIKGYFLASIFEINQPFNYNRFANIVISTLKEEWIVIANNDLIFHPCWLDELLNVEHPVVSPKSPADYRQKFVTKNSMGYALGVNFSGWCFMLKRSIWEQIGGFDEDFEFYCADNSFLEQLKKICIKPMLVVSSVVDHLLSQTLTLQSTLNGKTQKQILREQVIKFNKKYSRNVLNFGRC